MNAWRAPQDAGILVPGRPSVPSRISLDDREVHVWRVNLDRPPWPHSQLHLSLSPDERVRADGLINQRVRQRFIAARGMLRWLLAGYLTGRPAEDPSSLRLCYGPHGKPELATFSGSRAVRLNHSRSRDLGMYVISRGRAVGVDLEARRPVVEAQAIAERYFSPRERAVLAAAPTARRGEAFLRGWTGKEAWVKATGEGLSADLRRTEAPIAESDPPHVHVVDDDGVAARWSLWVPPPTEGHIASVVVEGSGHRLRSWSLEGSADRAASTRQPLTRSRITRIVGSNGGLARGGGTERGARTDNERGMPMGNVRNLSLVATTGVALVALIALLLLATPAGAQGAPTPGAGTGTGYVSDIIPGERTDFGQSGNWTQARTLTGAITEGPLDGTFEQTVTGVVRNRSNSVTFHGTLVFTGTIEGCGDDEHTITLGVNGRGQANPPVTEATVRVIGPSADGLHITGQGTVSQDFLSLSYDIEYRCR